MLGAYFYTPPSSEGEKSSAGEGVLPSSVTSSAGPYYANGESGNVVSSNGETTERETTSSSFFGSVRSMFSLHRRDSKGILESGADFGSRKEKVRPGETRTVVIAVISRMLLTPLILLPLMSLSAKFDIPKVFDE